MPINYFNKKLSVCMSVHNTAHLLNRSLETYMRQTLDKSLWSLIICNDCSDDDVWNVVEPYIDKMNITYVELKHHDGMRGGMLAFNMMYRMAHTDIIAETTPEVLLVPQTFELMLNLHEGKRKRFVTFKSFRFTHQIQMALDTVDWKSDLRNIRTLEGWNDGWVQQNVDKTEFRTHEISSYRKDDFFEAWDGIGFALAGDYGSCDPGFSGKRELYGWEEYVVMGDEYMQYHQWHPSWHFRASHYPQKYHNKWAHTLSNIYGDPRIPENGTKEIWDGNSSEWYNERELQEYRDMEKDVYATGYPILKNTIYDK